MASIISAGTGISESKTNNVITLAVDANSDEISEGSTNLFFTDARARGAVSATGMLTYNSGIHGGVRPVHAENVEDHVAASLVTGGPGITVTYADNGSATGQS